MREVKVRRTQALEKVRANREKHLEAYRAAVVDYHELLLQKARNARLHYQRIVDRVREHGDSLEVIDYTNKTFSIQPPACHVKSYDQAIAMLEMCVDDVISLRSDEFACYIMDDWDWKNEFQNTVAMYKAR